MLSALSGIWLMAAPAVLGYGDPAATAGYIVGPLAAGFAYVAVWEVIRGLRWVGVPLGLWLLAAPWLLNYDIVPLLNSTVVGLIQIVLACVRGTIKHRYGGGWAALFGRGHEDESREGV
jgi:hypothetical protein